MISPFFLFGGHMFVKRVDVLYMDLTRHEAVI